MANFKEGYFQLLDKMGLNKLNPQSTNVDESLDKYQQLEDVIRLGTDRTRGGGDIQYTYDSEQFLELEKTSKVREVLSEIGHYHGIASRGFLLARYYHLLAKTVVTKWKNNLIVDDDWLKTTYDTKRLLKYLEQKIEDKPRGETEVKGNGIKLAEAIKDPEQQKARYSTISIVDTINNNHSIDIYTVPRVLEYNSEASHAVIKPMGRNSAIYQYTGSEDILTFEIDWYSRNGDIDEVIKDCRLLEGFSKADGHGNKKTVLLVWGAGGTLFKDFEFVVLSAPYKLTQFSRGYPTADANKPFKDLDMMPVSATQSVTLARVSDKQLSFKEIAYVADYKGEK